MASVTVVKRMSVGSEWEVQATFDFDSSYPSGGESLTPAILGLTSISNLRAEPKGGYTFEYDYSAQTLKVMKSAAVAGHVHDVKLIGGITATEPVAVQGGDTLGKNAAADRTIAGADSATKGGIVSGGTITQALMEENTTTNLSALTGVKITARGL